MKPLTTHRIGVKKFSGLLFILTMAGTLGGCNSTPTSQDRSYNSKAFHARALQYDMRPRQYKQISVTEFAAQGFIALHQYLPIGTRIQIINPRSNRNSIVIISGKPDQQNRQQLILSHKAARKLGLDHRRQEKVLYKVLPKKTPFIQTRSTDAPTTLTLDNIPLPSPGSATQAKDRPYKVAKTYSGKASYYAHRFHGRKTANGERYDMHAMTAAHKKLPFNARVKVTNKHNGRSVTLRINDRGPYAKGRIIDVSLAAAKKLGMTKKGIVPVKVEVLKKS